MLKLIRVFQVQREGFSGCQWDTVDGKNPANQWRLGTLSQYFQGFVHPRWWKPDFFHQQYHLQKSQKKVHGGGRELIEEIFWMMIKVKLKTASLFRIPEFPEPILWHRGFWGINPMKDLWILRFSFVVSDVCILLCLPAWKQQNINHLWSCLGKYTSLMYTW